MRSLVATFPPGFDVENDEFTGGLNETQPISNTDDISDVDVPGNEEEFDYMDYDQLTEDFSVDNVRSEESRERKLEKPIGETKVKSIIWASLLLHVIKFVAI